MKIAIHPRVGSFSEKWIEYCKSKNMDYTEVNAFDNDIVNKLEGYDIFLWHWHHGNYDEVMVARYILAAIEKKGVKVFPSTATSWTFDNKVAQKYQLEAVNAPLIPTYIFYNEAQALAWVQITLWPKVFKLSRGAGSLNVRLVNSKRDAEVIVKEAFHKGFKASGGRAHDAIGRLKSSVDRKRVDWIAKFKRLPQTLKKIQHQNRMLGREIGYVYFQDFIPNNDYDIRITIIGDRAFGFTRNVRDKDFRASGSGKIDYDRSRIPLESVKTAFTIAKQLASQSIAFDFVLDPLGKPLIVETSYVYNDKAVYDCEGYWNGDLNWVNTPTWPQHAILEDLISTTNK